MRHRKVWGRRVKVHEFLTSAMGQTELSGSRHGEFIPGQINSSTRGGVEASDK
jgi:hypothetical protein